MPHADTRRIDDAIDRLTRACRKAHLPRPRAPKDLDAIAEVVEAVAPRVVPTDVLRFWERVDPESIPVCVYPHLTGPRFALDAWRSGQEHPGMVPTLLFPVAYESWGFVFVELGYGDHPGGALLEWGYGGEPFRVRFAHLVAYLDLLATMIELDEFDRRTDDYATIQGQRWNDACDVRLASALPLPGFGREIVIGEEAPAWPAHWQDADGLGAASRRLRSSTATIEHVLAAAAGGRAVDATVRARVVRLAGTAEGVRAHVDDGTGVLDVWCPAAVTGHGPVMGRVFEFDVAVDAFPPQLTGWDDEHRDAVRHACAGDLAGASETARELYAAAFGTTATARATAIRPVD